LFDKVFTVTSTSQSKTIAALRLCVLDGNAWAWRYILTHCCQIVSSMIAKSHDTNYNRKLSSRNEMTKIFAGSVTNRERTRKLKKFVV
jgi:hypothetical protein